MSVIKTSSSFKSASTGVGNKVESASGTRKYCACDPSSATEPKDLPFTHRPVTPRLQLKQLPLQLELAGGTAELMGFTS